MRRYGKWVLTLGIMAATPGSSWADFPVWPFGSKKPTADSSVKTGNQNQKVAEEIAAALRQARLNGSDIEIEFKNGVATLSGKIYDPAQKVQATQVVGKIPGVKHVDNRLSLVRAPQTAAANQPTLDRFAPKTAAPAETRKPSFAAAAPKPKAKSPSGIRQVSFESGGVPTDNQQVAEQIAASLSQAQFSGYDIQIQYQDGTATLSGGVADPMQRAQATQIVSRVPGVQQVDNQLQVLGGGQIPAFPTAYQPEGVGPMPPGVPPMAPPTGAGVPGMPAPPVYAAPGPGYNPTMYNQPHLPEHAWPAYAQYPNSAAVTYPTQYSASAWPYIGPFYPYPQVPLGWREAQLEWDDGYWALNFRPRTNRWWWFMHPENW